MSVEAAIDGIEDAHLVIPAPACEPDDPGRMPAARRHRPYPDALSCPPVGSRPVAPDSAVIAFTESTLRMVLEVVDRRRPVAQLTGYLSEPAIAAVLAHSRHRPAQACATPARVHRVRVQWTAAGAAEVFGSYTRGRRLHAFAGCVQPIAERHRPRLVPPTPPAGRTPADPSPAAAPYCAALPARRLRVRSRPEWAITALRLG
ncbi:Rv3235 family protein [Millisia brevis]|uniref:Rv3235 family protein n=1 Tax=Millisia brevis TaxID=264148 RepID=UPI000A5B6933|nr:Rv3235 family protein [Millisia brevis]